MAMLRTVIQDTHRKLEAAAIPGIDNVAGDGGRDRVVVNAIGTPTISTADFIGRRTDVENSIGSGAATPEDGVSAVNRGGSGGG